MPVYAGRRAEKGERVDELTRVALGAPQQKGANLGLLQAQGLCFRRLPLRLALKGRRAVAGAAVEDAVSRCPCYLHLPLLLPRRRPRWCLLLLLPAGHVLLPALLLALQRRRKRRVMGAGIQ
jgi:hypothetical protein